MKMLTKSVAALLLVGTLATPALAANATQMKDQNATTNGDQGGNPEMTSVRKQLIDDLTKAGFTDIKIMPESFLVRAKDSKGNPVMMMINPDSVTTVTDVSAPKSTSQKMNGGDANGEKVLSGKNANGDPTPPAKQ
jgi:hypothetical protein